MAEQADTLGTDEQAAISEAVEQGAAATRLAPSQFAQDLAAALVDPVCRALLLSLIREGVRLENAARAQSIGAPPPVKGSTKTSWVGDRLRQQQAQGGNQ